MVESRLKALKALAGAHMLAHVGAERPHSSASQSLDPVVAVAVERRQEKPVYHQQGRTTAFINLQLNAAIIEVWPLWISAHRSLSLCCSFFGGGGSVWVKIYLLIFFCSHRKRGGAPPQTRI